MMEVEKWMLKHYTQDLDMIKCNYCEEIFSDCNQMQNFNYHLCNIHNVIELDEHPECDNIRQNYKISSPMATCNHCKKTINLAFHGVHVLTIHLKIFHTNKLKIKISNVRDKYDILDNKATCKGCKETLKIRTNNAALSLRQHSHHCPYFKINFPHEKRSTEGTQNRSRVWDKYDVTNSNATCKGCKKILEIKINKYKNIYASLRQHLHYCPHFKTDFPLKKVKNQQIKKKRSHVWDKYDVTDSNATCKGCKRTLKITTKKYSASILHKHLHYCPHFKIDFPFKNAITKIHYIKTKKSRVWDKFDVIDSNATCKGCKKTYKITGENAASALHKHLRYCPHFKTDIPLKKVITKNQQIKEKRSHVWDKYDVIDSNAICKGCKKTLKITGEYATSILNKHLRYCPHFRIDFPDEKRITRKKSSHAWDKYDVIGNNATCKGCKRTIKINKHDVSYLRQHLHHCSHFKVDFPLKKEVSMNITQRSSHIWDKYDVTDNNATCKGCKKTLKIKLTSIYATGCLRQHLHYCPHFKTDFPLKKEIPYEITQKRSQIWNKYDIKDNNATCKGCKKTLKTKITDKHITSALNRHLRFCSHFKTDFPLKKVITKKQQLQEIKNKRSRVWDKYDVTDNNVTCKGCRKTLKIKVTSINAAESLRAHLLRCPHFKTDFPLKKVITKNKKQIRKKRSPVWDKYDVIDSNAICKGCKKTLKITGEYAASTLHKHLHCCPHFRIDFPSKKQIAQQKSHPWDKYDVTGSNATCKGCKKTLKVDWSRAASILLRHLHHCPHFSIDFPSKKQIRRKRSHTWDKYDVTGSNATCKGCKRTIKIKSTNAASHLLRHLHHCPHFKNNFPKKLKK